MPSQAKVSNEENIVKKVVQEQLSDDGVIKFDDGKKRRNDDELPQSIKEKYRKRDKKHERKKEGKRPDRQSPEEPKKAEDEKEEQTKGAKKWSDLYQSASGRIGHIISKQAEKVEQESKKKKKKKQDKSGGKVKRFKLAKF